MTTLKHEIKKRNYIYPELEESKWKKYREEYIKISRQTLEMRINRNFIKCKKRSQY